MNLKRIFDSLSSTSWLSDVIDPKTAQAVSRLVNSYFEPEQVTVNDRGLFFELVITLPLDDSLVPNLNNFANRLKLISDFGARFHGVLSNTTIYLKFQFGSKGSEALFRGSLYPEVSKFISRVEAAGSPERLARTLRGKDAKDLATAKQLITEKLNKQGVRFFSAYHEFPLYFIKGDSPQIKGYNSTYGSIIVKPISEFSDFSKTIPGFNSDKLLRRKSFYNWFVSYTKT